MDGRTDEMIDEGKRADYVPYEENRFLIICSWSIENEIFCLNFTLICD